jgi:hypothetical protein
MKAKVYTEDFVVVIQEYAGYDALWQSLSGHYYFIKRTFSSVAKSYLVIPGMKNVTFGY